MFCVGIIELTKSSFVSFWLGESLRHFLNFCLFYFFIKESMSSFLCIVKQNESMLKQIFVEQKPNRKARVGDVYEISYNKHSQINC